MLTFLILCVLPGRQSWIRKSIFTTTHMGVLFHNCLFVCLSVYLSVCLFSGWLSMNNFITKGCTKFDAVHANGVLPHCTNFEVENWWLMIKQTVLVLFQFQFQFISDDYDYGYNKQTNYICSLHRIESIFK